MHIDFPADPLHPQKEQSLRKVASIDGQVPE